jgi:hypothetical protein
MIALEFYRIAALDLKSQTPSSGFPHLIASRTYNVRGILIDWLLKCTFWNRSA